MGYDSYFMHLAMALAVASVDNGGGPFGAVIVAPFNGTRIPIGMGRNAVVLSKDPTAHAEICAIREASHHLQSHSLKGCVLYSSCEPCPMCYAAAHWAGITEIYYYHTHKQAAAIGFDDAYLYQQLSIPANERDKCVRPAPTPLTLQRDPFEEWMLKTDKTPY